MNEAAGHQEFVKATKSFTAMLSRSRAAWKANFTLINALAMLLPQVEVFV